MEEWFNEKELRLGASVCDVLSVSLYCWYEAVSSIANWKTALKFASLSPDKFNMVFQILQVF